MVGSQERGWEGRAKAWVVAVCGWTPQTKISVGSRAALYRLKTDREPRRPRQARWGHNAGPYMSARQLMILRGIYVEDECISLERSTASCVS